MPAKYDRIGIGYNQTRKADPYLCSRMHALLQPESENQYLDVGCGSGNYTIALHQKGVELIGVDPSDHMLELAREREPAIDWRKGTAEQLPVSDASVDGILASLTIHHWTDLPAAFAELNRVLTPNGRLVLFTSTPEQMEGYWLNHYFPHMLRDSILQMPALEVIQQAMMQGGFRVLQTELYAVRPDLCDHFLYCGKDRPELYLDPDIRKGISSFSDLANQSEVRSGLQKLEADIDSGAISNIRQHYRNERGDYLFVVGEKGAQTEDV